MPLYADNPTNSLTNYFKALALVAVTTMAGNLLHSHIPLSNLVMLYLLTVVLAALKLGLHPAIMTAVTSNLAFYHFFIPSGPSLMLLDKEYLSTFIGLLITSLVIATLVATARKQTDDLFERETETASLYRLSRDLAAAPDPHALYSAVVRNAESSIAAQVAIFHAAEQITAPAAATSGMSFTDAELATIDWTCKSGHRSITSAKSNDESGNLVCLPLVQAGSCVGVLVLREPLPGSTSQRLLEGIIAQTASTLQRIELSHQAEQAQLLQTRANFERALLSSISHDLRTPLVSVTGALTTLRDKHHQMSEESRFILLDTACNEADRLNKFVGNLLDMTRIEAGVIQMNSELCDLQELIGCALNAMEKRIGVRKIRVELSEELPLVMIDLVLMTQVLANLLDNALKYSSREDEISILAYLDGSWAVLEVADHGPGIPEQDLNRVFDKFYRIPIPEGAGGTGLGLSICKGIVEAHGGRIKAVNHPEGGVRMLVQLPRGET